MKNIKILVILCMVALGFNACKDDDEAERKSTPVIEQSSLSPETITYGDSVTLSAVVSDAVTPLSTLEVQMILNDELLSSASIRTKGNNATVNKKFKVPFTAGVVDGAALESNLTLINVDGYEAKITHSNVIVKRPVFEKLYLVLEDGTIKEMSPTADKDIFEVAYSSTASSFKVKIAQKVANGGIDYSGFVWANGDNALALGNELSSFYELSDPLIKLTEKFIFNAKTFGMSIEGSADAPIQINGVTLTPKDNKLTGSVAFTKDQTVTVSGIANPATTLNPDFFEVNGSTVKFVGPSGTYDLIYYATVPYLYVEQPTAVYPDALWICGVGMGRPFEPYVKTTSWNWNNPVDYVFCRKVSDGVFQSTVYLKHETGKEWTDEVSYKYFGKKGWEGELDAHNFTLPTGFIAKNDKNWGGTADLVPGVYKLTIDMNANTYTAEKLR
jgi:hypothetical protein